MPNIILDFETRSRMPIAAGAYNYASDASTDILCLGVICEGTGNEWLWYPSDGPLPYDLTAAIQAADLIKAHNATFDKLIWEFVGVDDYAFPELPANRWYCTSAQCRVNALPSSLDNATRAVGVKMRKDRRGAQLIKLLSIPNDDGTFNTDPSALKEMGDYCLQDCRATLDLSQSIRQMTPQEHADWLLTEDVNERGAKVDVELARLALDYAEDEKLAIAEALTEITGGAITKHTQAVRARNWVIEQCGGDDIAAGIVAELTVFKDGVKKLSMDKAIRSNLLLKAASGDLTIPDNVLDVIELIDQGSKSSVSKFQRMVELADPDDHRVRGAFVFAGAGQTQRFASRGLQMHNMRRDCWGAEEAIAIKQDMAENYELDNVMNTLSKLLRPTIIPDTGKVFVVGDWSAIEGRVLPWLTNDPDAEVVLDVFRSGEDIYMHTAAAMRIDDRFIGKVATLALGYQGAVGAFNVMAKAYGLALPEAQVIAIVKKWRNANQWAVNFWRECERAVIKAMRKPATYVPCGRCQFIFIEGLIGGTLIGVLPDGTMLQYPRAKLEYVETQWGGKHQVSYMKASLTPKADAKAWPRATLYGGIIAENLTQAVAGCLLRYSLRQLDDVVLHVHDEIVLEVPSDIADHSMTTLQTVMETEPDWAEGLPLKAEPVIMERYGK